MTKCCSMQVTAWLGAALVQAGMGEGLLAQAAEALAEAAKQADPGTAAHKATSGGSEQVASMSTNVPGAWDTQPVWPAPDIDALLQAIQLLSLAAIERLLPRLLYASGKSGSAGSA